MFLAWVRFGILITNIILSNQLSPPAITTSTKCAIENQKTQGFTPSQFFLCVRKENKLYFETRYCPSVKNTFYETEQRCLPSIGGGEVRCLIPGKRCSHNQLGPMAYPNKFKPNYYIVCLPKATHICRCYGNAIYDASTQMCRIISTTTDMGRDDSNGIIPKIICEKSGIHSTVELENPDKQKCVLFCYQKNTNDQFKLNIICARKTNLVDANVPMINPIDSITKGEENLPPEIRELIAQEFLKSTNSYDNLGWPLEKSTTENPQDEEKRKRTDITSIPTNGTWSSGISHTLNDRATSTQLSKFSTTEDEPEIRTTEKVTAQEGSVQATSDKILIPFLKDDETTIQASETSLESSTIQDDTAQSATIQNFKENHVNTPLSTTEYKNVQSTADKNFTQTTSSSFNEKTSTPLILVTEDETTITSVSYTTEDGNTDFTINQSSLDTPSSSQLITTEDIINSSSEKTSLASLTPEYGDTQWTTDQNFKKSTASTLSAILENKTTNQFNQDLLLSSVTPEGGSIQSTTYQNFKETSSIPFSATDDGTKKINPGTLLLMTEEETTNPSKITTTLVSDTTDGRNTKLTTNQNTTETSSSTQFLPTEDKITSFGGQTSLINLIPEDKETQSIFDANTLSPIIENKTTNQSSENLLFASATPDGLQSTAYHSFIETTRTPFSTTDNGPKETNFGTEEKTTNPSNTIISSVSDTTDGINTKRTANQNTIETSSTTQFLITENIINTLSDKTSLASLIPKDEETEWTTDLNFKKNTASTLSPIIDDEITNQFSDNLLLTSVTPERESMQSTAQQTFAETSRTSVLTTDDDLKIINKKEETASSNTIITTVSPPSEDINTKWTTNQNTTVTLSPSQFLTTEDIQKSSEQTSLASVTSKDGETKLIIDQNFKISTANTLSPILEDATTKQFSENLLFSSVTPEEGSIQSTIYQNFKETSSIPSSATEEETTNPPKTMFTTKWIINQNTIETSSSSRFLTTEDKITSSGDKTSLISLIPEDGGTRWTIDQDFKKSTADTLPLIVENKTTNQFTENPLLASATPEGESVQSTPNQHFKESTSNTQFSTTVDVDQKQTSQSNENLLLATLEGEGAQSTIYQNSEETSSTKFSTTVDSNLKETNSGAPLHIKNDEITNHSNVNLLLVSVTPEGESIQSTIYQKFKETSTSPFSTTVDSGLKATNSGSTTLPITDDEITNQSDENLLLASVTPEGESIQSTPYQYFKESTSNIQFLTTVDADLEKTNSDTTLLITENVTTNESSEKFLLQSTTPDGESTHLTPYHNFKENTPNSQFSTTENRKVEFKQTTSIAMSPIIEDKTIKSTPNEYSKQTTSGTLFSVTDETIIPTSEILAVESISTESENINSTGNRDIQTENLNSFASPSTTEHMLTTEFLSPNNWTERPGTEATSLTELLSSITTQLIDKPTPEKLNTTPSSEILTSETKSEISPLKETSSATYDDSTKIYYTPQKSDKVTLNLEKNLQSTISESTSTPTILFSSNSQSQEIETDVNALPSSSTEFTSTLASITPSISSLYQISTIQSSNWLLNDSENLTTNIPQDLPSTASSPDSTSDSIVVFTTEDTAKPVHLSTTLENLFTTAIDSRLSVESSTASDNYEYQSIIPVSDITNSVNTLLPAEAISESTSENSQQSSLSLEPFKSEEYSTETSSTRYRSTTQPTAFIEPADSDMEDYSTEVFTTIENVESNLNAEQIDSDQNINSSPQPLVELETSTIAIKPHWDVTDETSTSETFASNEDLEEFEYDPSSQGAYFGMAERCVCTGKRRYRNSCKKHYHCSKIGSLNRFIQSEIMECAHCLQFNAKKRICDFPDNVPECAVDDGSFNRICTAEGNYSIPLERNCRRYYECKRNWRGVIALQVKICQVGRIFSERLQTCVRGCRCRNAQHLPDRCPYKNAVLPDRFDCSKYYYCNNKLEVKTLQCSDEYVFDGEKCELKSEVICDPSNVYKYLSDDDDENCNT